MRDRIVLDPSTKIVNLAGRPPPVVLTLLIIGVGLFLIYAFADGPKWVAAHLAASAGTTLAQLQIYQPLSALWIHLETTSLLFNMLVLWVFGAALERWWGGRRFLLFWVVTGVIGLAVGVFFGMLAPAALLYGSGGATAAMLLAMAVVFPVHMPFMFKGVLPLKIKWLVLALAGIMVVGDVMRGAYLMIAVEAGGAAMGALFLFSLRKLIGQAQLQHAKKKFKVIEGGKKDDKRWLN